MRFWWLLALIAGLGGCAPGYFGQGMKMSRDGHHQEAVDLFYQEIRERPDSASAWRELGIAFYNLQEYGKAQEALNQAIRIEPDPRAHLYLGLLFEEQQDYDQALEAYRNAVKLRPDGRTEKLLRAHIRDLVQKRIKEDIDQALADEANLEARTVPANTIAVVDFDASGLPPDLAPLGRGLVEFTSLDLAKVRALTVVERARLATLLAELELSREGLTDPGSRLRVGRLLGARNLVTGTLALGGQDELEIYGAVGSTLDAAVLEAPVARGDLESFFALQKDLVFGIIGSLGIELSRAERDSIEAVPTESVLAFLAYCRGLEAEQNGDLDQAVRHYRQAAEQDPGFGEAKARGQDASDALEAAALGMTGGAEAFETAVVSTLVDAYQQQLYLIMLAENTPFIPTDVPEVGLSNENPLQPNPGPANGVAVTIRGRFDGSR
ncbi:MAG: tetratricopeptide repeat protein [bacterium]